MQEIINDIKDKLNFSFTVIILLILFIEKFLKIHRPEQAEMATLSYFIIIPLYIFLYLAFYSRKNKLKIRKIIRYINNLLSINLLSIAILIMIIANIGNIDKIANWLKQCSPMLNNLIIYFVPISILTIFILIIIIPVIIIPSLFKKKSTTHIAQQSKSQKILPKLELFKKKRVNKKKE